MKQVTLMLALLFVLGGASAQKVMVDDKLMEKEKVVDHTKQIKHYYSEKNKSKGIIWSDDFETDKGWTMSGEFERGEPQGLGGDQGQYDPNSAYGGSNVLGTDLSGLGAHPGDYENNLSDRELYAITPIIDCSTFVGIRMSFQRYLCVESPTYDHAYIDISNDGGSTWNQVWTNTTSISDSDWSLVEFDISSYADGNANVQIRFAIGTTDGSYQYPGWNIDDFTIYCPDPYQFSVTAPEGSEVGSGNDYYYSVTIENTGTSSDNFTPAIDNAGEWAIGLLETDSTTSLTTPMTIAAGATDTFLLKVTVPETGVVFGETDTTSITVTSAEGTKATESFDIVTTAIAPIQPPYTESFSNGYPPNDYWQEFKGILDTQVSTSETSSVWTEDGFANNGTTEAARINIFGTSVKDWFSTPSIDLGDGTTKYNLVFDLALTDYGNPNPPESIGDDDKFAVVISTDDGDTWSSNNTLRIWDTASSVLYGDISTAGEEITIPLSAYTGIVKIGFYGESTVSNADNDLSIDNISIEEMVANDFSVSIPSGETVDAGSTFDYIVGITNTGSSDDTYNLTLGGSPSWTYALFNEAGDTEISTLSVASGLTEHFNVRVTVDAGAEYGDNDIVEVTATSQNDGGLTSTFDITTTAYATIKTPYSEYFDGVSAPTLPGAWNEINTSGFSTAYVRTVEEGSAPSQPNAAKLYNYSYTTSSVILVAPELESITGNQVTMMAKGGSGYTIHIGTLTDPNDAGTFTPVDTIALTASWEEYSVLFDDYDGSDTYIGIKHGNAGSYQTIYIDNFQYNEIPQNDAAVTSLLEPIFDITTGNSADVVVELTNRGMLNLTSVNIDWSVEGTVQTQYNWSGDLAYNEKDTVTLGTPTFGSSGYATIQINTSSPNNTSDDFTANDTLIAHVGVCDMLTVPYSESFGGTPEGTLPIGYDSLIVSTSSYGYVEASQAQAFSDSVSIELYNAADASAGLFLTLPEINDYTNKLLSFYGKGESASSEIILGTFANKSDIASFTPFDTISLSTSWELYRIDLSAYAGSDPYIAFKHGTSATYENLYIDDIEWDNKPANDAGITAITIPTSEFLAGTHPIEVELTNFGTDNLTQVDITYSLDTLNTTTTHSWSGNLAPLGTETVEINGGYDFSAGGEFQIIAYTESPNGVADEYEPNDTLSVSIAGIVPTAVPYSQDFENDGAIPNGWTNDADDGGASWNFVTTNAHCASGDHTTGSGYYAHLNDYSIYSSQNPVNLLSPIFDLSGGSYNLVYYAWIGTNSADNPIHIDISEDLGETWTEDVYVHNHDISSQWFKVQISLADYAETAMIRFRGISIYGSNEDNSGIDDVAIEEVAANDAAITSIEEPYTTYHATTGTHNVVVRLKNIGSDEMTAATIDWSVDGNAQSQYSWTGSLTIGQEEEVTIGSYDFSTEAYYDIEAIVNLAGDAVSSNDTASITAGFASPLSAPSTQNFDAVSTPDLPLGWNFLTNSTNSSIYIKTSTTYQNSSPNSVILYNNTEIDSTILLVSPEIEDFTQKQLVFYARGSDGYSLDIGTITNKSDLSTFTLLDSIGISGEWTEYTVDFSAYAGSDNHIAIRHGADGTNRYIYVDDVTWMDVPQNDAAIASVEEPNGFFDVGSSDIIVTLENHGAINLTSADIDWKVNGVSQTQYNWAGNLVTDASESVTIGSYDFNANGEYTIEVWINSANETTDDDPRNDSASAQIYAEGIVPVFTENFDSVTAPAIPAGWRTIFNSSSSWAELETSTSQSHSPDNSLRMYNSGDASAEMLLVTPKIVGFANNRIRFYAYGGATTELSVGTIDLSDSTYTEITLLTLTASWEEYTVDVSSYAGSDEHIVFKHNNAGTYQSIYIDDFTFEQIPQYDAGVVSIDSPSGAASSTEDIIATIGNYAEDTLVSLDINWTVKGASQGTYNWSGSLPKDSTAQVTLGQFDFSTSTHGENAEIVAISANPNGETDGNQSNDTATAYVNVVLDGYLYEDFEAIDAGSFPPVNWTIIDNDGDGAWAFDNTNAYEGTNCASVFYDTPNDDWFITPKVILEDGSIFSFWATSMSGSYYEDFKVLVSKSGTDITNFTIQIDSVDNTPQTYTNYNYVLTDNPDLSAGDEVFIAIQCISNDQLRLAVDNIAGPALVASYEVSFTVDDGTDPIENATITLEGEGDLLTNVDGQATFTSIYNGTYNYTINANGYDEASGTITVSGSNASKTVSLNITTYMATFNVTDGTNPITGATVSLTGYGDQTTDVNGDAVFSSIEPENDIVYTVSASLYQTYTDSITVVDQDINEAVAMTLTPYDVTFTVTDGTDPIQNATVNLDGYGDLICDGSGQVTFTDVAPASDIAYTVNATGYDQASGTVDVVNQNVTEDVTMTLSTYSIVFHISDGENAVPNATIELNGYGSGATNTSGVLTFTNIAPANNISYTINADGFDTLTDSIDVIDSNVDVYDTLSLTTYAVTFNITDGTNPIENASVTLDGYSTVSTDATGLAIVPEVEPAYGINYTVTASGYDSNAGSVDVVDADVTENVELTITTYTVTFNVTNGTDPIGGAVVTLAGYSPVTTNASGIAAINDVEPGENINYTITADDYDDYVDSLSVVDQDVTKNISMTLTTYTVTFEVSDGANPIKNATVSLSGYTDVLSGADGIATVNNVVPAYGINYTVNAAGYDQGSGSVDVVDSDVAEAVQLNLTTYTVTFTITDGTDPISGAIVTLTGYSSVTANASGVAIVNNVAPENNIHYTVTANGYDDMNDSISVVDQNLSETVSLTVTSYSVAFTVTDGTDPIQGATVTLNGYTNATTGADGTATINNVVPAYGIVYTVDAAGYDQGSGSVDVVDSDVTEDVQLNITTYTVTFTITDGSDPISGAIVTLSGYSSVTSNTSGIAVINNVAPANNIHYAVTANGYNDLTDSVDVVDQNVDETVAMSLTTFDVTFEVTDGTNPIDGATISLNGYADVTTNASGIAIIHNVVPAYGIGYTVNANGYDPAMGSVDVVDSDVNKSVSMSLTTYSVNFTITDGTNPVSGANINLTGYGTITTNSNGEGTFEGVLPADEIAYSISAIGFEEANGTIAIVDSDVNESISLTTSKHDITFNVLDNETSDPVSGASISFNNLTQTTDVNGETIFTQVEYGSGYTYTVEQTGYNTNTGTVNVDANKTITISLVPESATTYNVTFVITDGTNPVQGANIALTGYGEQTTNSNGEANFTVTIGDIDYTVTKSGYHNNSGTVSVVDSDVNENVTLDLIAYDVTFIITDGTNPIQNATISLNGYNNVATNASGEAIVVNVVPAYGILYTVVASGYDEANGSIDVLDSDITKNISLNITTYSATFEVSDGTVPIQNALVTIGATTVSTNSSGEATIDNLPTGTHSYTITKTGYNTVSANLEITDSDVTESVTMTLTSYNVTFSVSDANGPVSGATVALDGYTNATTDATGQATVPNVIPAYGIAYTATAPGHEPHSGSIDVIDGNITENVSLPLSTYSALFTVTDGTNPIQNATVTIGATTVSTNASGEASITNLTSGTYSFTVSKTNYNTVTDQIVISDSDVTETVVLTLTSYSVTFNVSDENGPVSGATVALDGYTETTTDATGQATVHNVIPAYGIAYTVTAPEHDDLSGSVDIIDGNVTENVLLPITTYRIAFTVNDGSNPIQNATVTIGATTVSTNASGEATIENLAPGTYSYTVSKTNYNTFNDQIVISNSDVNKTVTLTLTSYNVAFIVSDVNGPVQGATVSLDGYSDVITNASGEAIVPNVIPAYGIAYTVSASIHDDVSGTIDVIDIDITKEVTLELTTYNATFTVTDGTNPIQNATVTINSTSKSTNASGVAIFTDLLPDTYSYSVEKSGYDDYSSQAIIADGDISENISMVLTTYNVSFIITDGQNPLSGATVSLSGYGSETTDANGIAIFGSVEPEAGLAYTVSNNGYETASGTVDVTNSDIAENVSLTLITYNVTFTVANSKGVIPGATIILDGYDAVTTNTSGVATVENVVPGNGIAYTINASGYYEFTGSVDVIDSDVIESVTMSIITYSVNFTVNDGTDHIEGAIVSLNGYGEALTNANGLASFANVIPQTGIAYTVVADGYFGSNGTVTVTNEDVDETVSLTLITYNVTFAISDGTNPIEGAIVNLAGYGEMSTNIDGHAIYDGIIPETDIAYTVVAGGFYNSAGTIDVIDSDIIRNVSLELIAFDVTFYVTDGTNPIQGANVNLTGYSSAITDASGNVTIQDVVPEDNISYTVNAEGYYDRSGEISVVDQDIIENTTLEQILYDVTFEISDGTTPIEGATVTLSGYGEIVTDIDGLALFSDVVPQSGIEYSVFATNYNEYSGIVDVIDQNATVPVVLDLTTYSAEFNVSDESGSIEGATVALDGYGEINTDANGVAVFENIVPAEGIAYTVTAIGYSDQSGSVDVTSDITENVVMTMISYTVIFNVTDGTNPIEGATISINGTELTTNSDGVASISLHNGEYNYTITADNFGDYSSSVIVDGEDVDVSVEMVGMNDNEIASIEVYPNPSQGIFNIQVSGTVEISIFNSLGNFIMTQKVTNEGIIDLGNQPRGIYFMQIEQNQRVTTKRLILE